MTNELDRIRILEGKISKVVAYINQITTENQKLKQQIKDLKSDKRDFDDWSNINLSYFEPSL